jgi:hypothetical protein
MKINLKSTINSVVINKKILLAYLGRLRYTLSEITIIRVDELKQIKNNIYFKIYKNKALYIVFSYNI